MKFIIILLCLINLLFFSRKVLSEELSVGFIYREPPEEAYYMFDWLVVDPDNFSWEKLEEKYYIKKKKAKLIAYVSLGEIEPYRSYYKYIKKDWIIGENKAWKTYVADIRNKEYQNFLLEKVISKLDKFDGIFFDTLDSYQSVLKKEEFKSYEDAETEFIKKVKKKYPSKIILINRGFEIIDKLAGVIDGLVAESLFYGLDVKSMKYKPMKEDDTQWLLDKLNYVKNLGIKVIVIDYVEPKNKQLAKNVAKKIYEYGFIPYITDKDLKTVGTSIYQLKPRKILMFYDSKVSDPAYTDINRFYQTFLEYLGYVPVLYDIRKGLPNRFLADEYAGILIKLSKIDDEQKFVNWIKAQIDSGIKVFFMDNIPISEEFLGNFGIYYNGSTSIFDKFQIVYNKYNFFETEPDLKEIPIINISKGQPILKVKIKDKTFVPLAITDWGGYALEGSFTRDMGQNILFVFDPVEVFKDVFKPDFPALDVTTENGRRILTAHIDGDAFFGFANFDPSKNLGEVIRDEILTKYKIPHTVSIIEAEVSPQGLYPDKSEKLEEIARSIFSLDNVEPASHSFSHPFKWQSLENLEAEGVVDEKQEKGYNLPIKNYIFSLEREILGSIDYINKNLVPVGKKVKVFLWTGDCVPSENALKLTYKIGIYNVNGGDTVIDAKNPFFSNIGPMGLNRDDYFQVYAPIQNENIYTNLWRDYYGYINVIDTFKLTDRPYRFKPISIYYHFYSGQELSSLKALYQVYDYALSQEVNPMFLSEYAQRVLEFRNTALCEDVRDGSLVIRGEGNLKTVRFATDVKPDIFKSKGILGFKSINNSIYVHLDNSGDYKIILSDKEPKFYLLDTNGQISNYKLENNTIFFRLKSYLPLEFRIYNTNCKINIGSKNYTQKIEGNIYEYRFKTEKETYVEAYCN